MRIYVFFFFFSSRRRHTRLVSDWSSDVCSSDLLVGKLPDHLGGVGLDPFRLREPVDEAHAGNVLSSASRTEHVDDLDFRTASGHASSDRSLSLSSGTLTRPRVNASSAHASAMRSSPEATDSTNRAITDASRPPLTTAPP